MKLITIINKNLLFISSIAIIVLTLGIIAYYFVSQPDEAIITEHQVIPQSDLEAVEPTEPEAEAELNITEYSLTELEEELGLDYKPNWIKALPQIHPLVNYISKTDETGWKVGIADFDKVAIQTITDKHKITVLPGYRLTMENVDYSNKYQLPQLLNRIKKLGYPIINTRLRKNKVNINIGPFKTYTRAVGAGEKIHFYYRTSNLFPAGFKVYKQNIPSITAHKDKILINVSSNNTFEEALKTLNLVKSNFPELFVYLHEVQTKYDINIGFLNNVSESEATLEKIKITFPEALMIQQ